MNPLKVIVTLSYKKESLGNRPYRIESVKNDIGVQITAATSEGRRSERYHVGDYLTEAQASELLSEPGIEVATVVRK